MISLIQGNIFSKSKKNKDFFVDVLTISGVGYRVWITERTFSKIEVDSEITLRTYHSIREDNQQLFGFSDECEKDLFELLITVNGVGPKLALAIMSEYDNSSIVQIINDSNDKLLSSVSGVGSKTAKRIILELQSKIEISQSEGKSAIKVGDGYNSRLDEIKQAMESLGYKGNELNIMLNKAKDLLKDERGYSVEDIVKRLLVG